MGNVKCCPHCGAEVQFDGQECCWECGKSLDVKSVETPKPVESTQSVESPKAEPVADVKPEQSSAKVSSTPSAEVQTSSVASAPMASSAPKAGNNNKVLLGVLVAVIVVLAVGLVVVLLGKDDDKNAVSEYQTEFVTSGTTDVSSDATYENDDEYDHIEEDEFQPDDADLDMLFKTQYDFACERLVTVDDIRGLDAEDLRIMRNWIFARHGYIFKSQDLKDYFGQMPWYEPRYSDVTSQLSSIEKKNIEFIKRYE